MSLNRLKYIILQFLTTNSPFIIFSTYRIPMQQTTFLQQHLPKTIAVCSEYREKWQDLFRTKQGSISVKHMVRGIIINARSLFNLVQSNFLLSLRGKDLESYYQLKSEILGLVRVLMQDFPLNAKFIYEESSIIVQGNRRINFVSYLIKEVRELFRLQVDNPPMYQHTFQQYKRVAADIFYQICNICTLRTSELKQITNSLTDFYYEQKLYTKLVGDCFRLLDAGLQERNITPYLYFVGNHKNDSVRVLYSSNKWHFSKGMTIYLWINMLKRTDCRLFWMATDDGSEIVIRIQEDSLVIESGKGQKREKDVVNAVNIPLNSPTMIGIELQPSSESFFKASSFKLNIKINGIQYLNVAAKLPSFDKSEFIVQFSLLSNFIGKLYATIITARPELNKWEDIRRISQYGICRESLVWEFISMDILKQQSILCIFNPERNFQGLLLNYVSQKNHACFEGKVSQVKYHKYDSKVIDIYLPFLHFLSVISEKNSQWMQLFDLIIQHILQIIGRENYEIDSIMLLLYFLQVNSYKISQSTLNCLYYHMKDHQNFYLSFVIKYLDVHALIQNGLKIDQSIQPFSDPVQKSILMFHLQTLWKQKWNVFQGFEGWWSPHFFSSQNDEPFNPKDFIYNPDRESRVQWSVLNLVTKDCCKCLVEPIFITPSYVDCTRFQQQYMKKECYNQYFKVNLNKKAKNQKLVCQKGVNSHFDKIKSKIMKNADIFSPMLKKDKSGVKQFQSQCLFIDILTVVQGQIMIAKQGFIIFTSAHKNKGFDHMCIKAFKNQEFYYLNIPFGDVRKVYKKRFNATHNAVYIKTKDGKEMMFHFYHKNAEAFLALLQGFVKIKKDSFYNYVNSNQPLHWIDKSMSNYEYLQWLNQIAGRNYNDITQYPVLPWVFIANQQQQTNAYRDLTKNMGSQGDKQRVQRFRQKYEQNNEEQLFNEYHYGTHYSSSAIIFNYLIRIRPYSVGALTLQSGKFDCADRIFYNYCGSWLNAISSPTDIRQLIPQVYTLPQMFINKNNYEYGVTQQKTAVDNVILPQWSNQNPFLFVSKLRKQLQSRYVSENINHWIDLIYGFKQRGKEAVQNLNIFYPLTYQNCIDLQKVADPQERISFQTQIAHFGQNPSQIIGNNPHPSRRAVKQNWQGKLIADGGQLTIQKCFLSKAPMKEEKFLFKSVFEGRNSILSIKFISEQFFFVLRKHEYYQFKILSKKADFLSKQQTISYELQSCSTSINYKQLSIFVPVTSINDEIVIIGGFYDGNVQIIFLKQPKYNRAFKFPTNTITAINYQKAFQTLFIGDQEGYLRAYKVAVHQKQLQFQQLRAIKAHDSKINDITINYKANLLCTCSEDGSLNLYNLYSQAIIRTIHQPLRLPINFAQITTNPLYAVVFYSKENSTIYVYSINGQFLDSVQQKSGFIYNLSIIKSSDSTQCLVYLNAQRELFIWQLPFLNLRRKVKVKRDDYRISCFQTCHNGKIAINGTQDGALQIIANPLAY